MDQSCRAHAGLRKLVREYHLCLWHFSAGYGGNRLSGGLEGRGSDAISGLVNDRCAVFDDPVCDQHFERSSGRLFAGFRFFSNGFGHSLRHDVGLQHHWRLLCGVLGMRRDGRRLAVLFPTCMGMGILSLMLAGSIHFIHAYSVLTGIGFDGMIVSMPHLPSTCFGLAKYARILGWAIPVVTLMANLNAKGTPPYIPFASEVIVLLKINT